MKRKLTKNFGIIFTSVSSLLNFMNFEINKLIICVLDDGGSDDYLISGWIISLFPFLKGGKRNNFCWEGKTWKLTRELDEFEMTKHLGLSIEDFGYRLNKVPFTWKYYGVMHAMVLVGGLVGVHLNPIDSSSVPVFGYGVMTTNSSKNFDKTAEVNKLTNSVEYEERVSVDEQELDDSEKDEVLSFQNSSEANENLELQKEESNKIDVCNIQESKKDVEDNTENFDSISVLKQFRGNNSAEAYDSNSSINSFQKTFTESVDSDNEQTLSGSADSIAIKLDNRPQISANDFARNEFEDNSNLFSLIEKSINEPDDKVKDETKTNLSENLLEHVNNLKTETDNETEKQDSTLISLESTMHQSNNADSFMNTSEYQKEESLLEPDETNQENVETLEEPIENNSIEFNDTVSMQQFFIDSAMYPTERDNGLYTLIEESEDIKKSLDSSEYSKFEANNEQTLLEPIVDRKIESDNSSEIDIQIKNDLIENNSENDNSKAPDSYEPYDKIIGEFIHENIDKMNAEAKNESFAEIKCQEEEFNQSENTEAIGKDENLEESIEKNETETNITDENEEKINIQKVILECVSPQIEQSDNEKNLHTPFENPFSESDSDKKTDDSFESAKNQSEDEQSMYGSVNNSKNEIDQEYNENGDKKSKAKMSGSFEYEKDSLEIERSIIEFEKKESDDETNLTMKESFDMIMGLDGSMQNLNKPGVIQFGVGSFHYSNNESENQLYEGNEGSKNELSEDEKSELDEVGFNSQYQYFMKQLSKNESNSESTNELDSINELDELHLDNSQIAKSQKLNKNNVDDANSAQLETDSNELKDSFHSPTEFPDHYDPIVLETIKIENKKESAQDDSDEQEFKDSIEIVDNSSDEDQCFHKTGIKIVIDDLCEEVKSIDETMNIEQYNSNEQQNYYQTSETSETKTTDINKAENLSDDDRQYYMKKLLESSSTKNNEEFDSTTYHSIDLSENESIRTVTKDIQTEYRIEEQYEPVIKELKESMEIINNSQKNKSKSSSNEEADFSANGSSKRQLIQIDQTTPIKSTKKYDAPIRNSDTRHSILDRPKDVFNIEGEPVKVEERKKAKKMSCFSRMLNCCEIL